MGLKLILIKSKNNMFTDKDFKEAINNGIFDANNNVTANPSQVIRYFEKWAETKCKETAKNVRHEATDIVIGNVANSLCQAIMNIPFNKIKPK